MSLEPEFHLKHTNVSQPRLSHQSSKQSVAASLAASEGYYSASEHSSSNSDGRKPLFQTPPSRHRTPAQSHEQLPRATDAPLASLRGVGIARQHPQHIRPQSPAVSTLAEERPGTQEPRRPLAVRDMDADSQATTPGQDTTPYIRFAIDQLTRDEEVRGSRTYPDVRSPVHGEEDDYPVERIVPDNGLGYMAQEQRTQQRMSQSIPRKPIGHSSTRQASAQPPTVAPQSYNPQYLSQQPQQPPSPRAQRDVFVASSQSHAQLHFLPAILRPVWLGFFIFLCLLMLALLISAAVYSNRNAGIGLWDYVSFGDGRYFVFEYLPTLLGMLILLWLIQIQTALQRIMPFISMASNSFH